MFSRLARRQLPAVRQLQQARLKRSKAGLNPDAQRVVTQLSVMSAGRKMPKMLKLCNEDYVKHKTIMKAWSVRRKEQIREEEEVLKKQYEGMKEASEDLKRVNERLFELSNRHEYGKRFPLELRVPTEYPARQVWYYDYVRKREE
ncbi:DEKNAAC105342 [Brettanomyces naardenensis]|uniref:Large ribosomal subunit protein mL40 n=1 Tax=Brettanomyces naardenensis TaxID=13370 RepID=A0A448YTF6_BRENA|nr:DEKNAAC105342 [Brettanomyces naardenensis]